DLPPQFVQSIARARGAAAQPARGQGDRVQRPGRGAADALDRNPGLGQPGEQAPGEGAVRAAALEGQVQPIGRPAPAPTARIGLPGPAGRSSRSAAWIANPHGLVSRNHHDPAILSRVDYDRLTGRIRCRGGRVLAEASSEQLAPAADQTRSAPANDQSTLVGRALSRWSRAIRDIATSTRLPFLGGDDPDLGADQADKLRAEMRACLEARGGEALARAQAAGIASVYLGLSPTGRTRFFGILATEFGVDRAEVDRAIAHYQEAEDEADKLEAERALRRALVSPRMRLLTKFNALPEGTRFLIDMRAHLLALNSEDSHFRALDADFRHLLATWFDIGFLRRARLTWDSPASLLEKIIAYEAVHEIRSWQDLHHRLDGDRRCYAFFHPSLPDEPLIFLQVALVQGLAGRIEPLLDEGSPDVPPERADTAVFYSITNTLYGLRGISFGNFL